MKKQILTAAEKLNEIAVANFQKYITDEEKVKSIRELNDLESHFLYLILITVR